MLVDRNSRYEYQRIVKSKVKVEIAGAKNVNKWQKLGNDIGGSHAVKG